MMRSAIFVLAALAGLSAAAAFDSEAWLGKRRLMGKESARLRKAYASCVAKLQMPADDVTIPVDTHPDGSVKTIVNAKRAQYFLKSGLVWAEGVVVRKHSQDGSLDLRIEAENCVIDRQSRSGWVDGRAKIVQGSTVFTGRNVFFSSPEEYVKVFRNVKLLTKDAKVGGIVP